MPASKKISDFLNSEKGDEARRQLICMMDDASYNTEATYTANQTLYPDNHIPFVDKHMNYLSVHPNIDPVIYLGNLRLMTRIK